jgi:hypothetical protein
MTETGSTTDDQQRPIAAIQIELSIFRKMVYRGGCGEIGDR